MEMKYYNPSNNFRAPIPREPRPYMPPKPAGEVVVPKMVPPVGLEEAAAPQPAQKPEAALHQEDKKKELDRDELLLLGIIFLLLLNACDDYLLLMVLGYLFLSGKN